MSRSCQNRSKALPAAFAGLAVLLLLAVAGCGDDDASTTSAGSTGADTPTSTNLEPTDKPATIPDLPINDDPSAVVCTGKPKNSDGEIAGVFDATAVVGEKLGRAEKQAAAQGCSIRVAMDDGEPLALTQDFRPDRVNVAVEDGKITEIIDIG